MKRYTAIILVLLVFLILQRLEIESLVDTIEHMVLDQMYLEAEIDSLNVKGN